MTTKKTAFMIICMGLLFTGSLTIVMEAKAQDLPSTQLWLSKLDNGVPSMPLLISENDRYNNQPMFSPDGNYIYFTSEQDDGQTDIARYEMNSGQLSMVNHSPESEYSPTPIPDHNAVSVIRVEPPDQLQRLWSISTSNGKSTLLMSKVEPVGYHSWIDHESVAVFILGDSFSLHSATIGDQPSTFLADNIGRTIRKHPESGQILFVDKNSEPWSIASIGIDGTGRQEIMKLFPDVEDFEIDAKGRYWMGSGSKLYQSSEDFGRWELTADFQAIGISSITRLASSPDGNYLAIVGSR